VNGERGLRVAVVGATEIIGAEVVSLLAERRFPLAHLSLYSSRETAGEEVDFRDGTLRVERLPDTVPMVDVMFLCSAIETAATLGTAAVAAGTLTIDLAPHATPDADAPAVLGVGDLSPVLRHASGGLLVRMAHPLARLAAVPLRARGALARVELSEFLRGRPRVVANVVEVPAFFGHAASLAIELEAVVGADEARKVLRETPSVVIVEGDERFSTLDVVGADAICILDLRQEGPDERWLHLWALGDNVRQGAALPAVAIAESLLESRGLSRDRDPSGSSRRS
jgi:aspartate-semialdehyde dehydrogenase